jgi:hypothetical protein
MTEQFDLMRTAKDTGVCIAVDSFQAGKFDYSNWINLAITSGTYRMVIKKPLDAWIIANPNIGTDLQGPAKFLGQVVSRGGVLFAADHLLKGGGTLSKHVTDEIMYSLGIWGTDMLWK